MYVGKGAACVQNGEVKTFRRTKVTETLTELYSVIGAVIKTLFYVFAVFFYYHGCITLC